MNSGFSLHFLLQTSELKGGKLREVVANHKHLHLPRLSSRSLFDELCPEERFRSQRRLVIYSQLVKRILKPWSKCCSSTKKLLLTISNSVTDLKKLFSHCSLGVQHIASCQLLKGPIHSRWNHSFSVWNDSTLKWKTCSSGGFRGGARGARGPPPYFSTKMRPKRNFWRLPPLISGYGWPPLPLIWRSASATLQWISSKLFIFCFRLCVVLFTKQGHQAKEKLVLRLLAKNKMYQRDHRVQFLYLYEDVQKEVIQELNEGLKDDRCTDNSTAAKVNVLFSFSYAGWSWITFTNHD